MGEGGVGGEVGGEVDPNTPPKYRPASRGSKYSRAKKNGALREDNLDVRERESGRPATEQVRSSRMKNNAAGMTRVGNENEMNHGRVG